MLKHIKCATAENSNILTTLSTRKEISTMLKYSDCNISCSDLLCPYIPFCRYYPEPDIVKEDCVHKEQITIRAKQYLKYLRYNKEEKEGKDVL